MAARQTYSVQDNSAPTNSSTTVWVSGSTLTFTPDANADYLLLWCGRYDRSGGTGNPIGRLFDGTTELGGQVRHLIGSGLGSVYGGIYKLPGVASPGSKSFNCQILSDTSGQGVRLNKNRLFAFKMYAQDSYAESNAAQTTSSTTYQDALTLNFSNAAAGTFAVFASAELDFSAGAGPVFCRLHDGTNAWMEGQVPSANGARRPWMGLGYVAAGAGVTQTWKIQWHANTGSDTARITNARIAVLWLPNFKDSHVASALARTTRTSNVLANKISQAPTLNAADQFIIGSICTDSTTQRPTTNYIDINAQTDGGTSQPATLNIAPPGTEPEFWFTKATFAGGTGTHSVQWAAGQNGNTTGAASAVSIIIELNDAAVSATVTPTGVAATGAVKSAVPSLTKTPTGVAATGAAKAPVALALPGIAGVTASGTAKAPTIGLISNPTVLPAGALGVGSAKAATPIVLPLVLGAGALALVGPASAIVVNPALHFADRVWEHSSTTGTGTLTLTGALAAYRSFAAIGENNLCDYCILDGAAWEVGQGRWNGAGPTLTRDIPRASSAGGARISCSGTQSVFLTFAAIRPSAGTRTVLTAGAGTYVTPDGCTLIYVRLLGGGGAGGSCADSGQSLSCAGIGGAAGAPGELTIRDPLASYPYAVGAGGTPGAAGVNPGGNGGDTTFGNARARGGAGGPGGDQSAALVMPDDSLAPLGGFTTGCDFNPNGAAWGRLPYRYAPAKINTGAGGSTLWGGGGPALGILTNVGSAGNAGLGLGSGGSGAGSAGAFGSHAAQTGGPGAPGIIIVDERY